MDRSCLEKTMEHFQLKTPVQLSSEAGGQEANAFVLMEVENSELEECEKWLSEVFEKGLVIDGVMAQNEREAKELWHYREGIAESIIAGHNVHQEDVSVPVSKLAEFYSEIHQRYQKAFQLDQSSIAKVFFFGHIGDGNLHIFIQGPKTGANSSMIQKFLEDAKKADLELFQVLKQFCGSISAEHGIGLLKKHALKFSRTEDEIKLMQGVKKVFDPKGLLNPGKLFNSSRQDQKT
jgi:FAD/FMN-containing dehydrogenase